MFFTKKNRKKNLIVFFLALFLFSGVVFLFSDVHSVQADPTRASDSVNRFDDCAPLSSGFIKCWASGGAESNMGDNIVVTAFKWFLYAIFTVFGWMASVAITLFEWVIKPENISGGQGLLNQSVVYEMWKFIRDFFNLFFILVLLYIAFKIVFQIEHDFKKTLLSVILAALYINFSFPVSRVLIDVTNVPMYFFANQMATGNGRSPGEGGGYTSLFSSAMSASQIKGILIPGAQDGGSFNSSKVEVKRLLIAVIFMFLFSITLLVLAVMFVVRLVALVILVIFSSVGFSASIVPGLSSYADMWWKNFWKYAFFGPAAMLMVLVSVRFFSALGDAQTGIFKGVVAAANNNVASDPTFFASMALFSVPIIMLWMAMGLAQEFSIAGASSVVGLGQKASKWVGALPVKGVWGVTKFAGRKLDKNVLAKHNVSPKAWIKAVKEWGEHSKHEDEIAIDIAKGRAHNAINETINKTLGQIPGVKALVVRDTSDYEMAELEKVKTTKKKEATENAGGIKDQSVALKMMKEAEEEHDHEKIMAAADMLSETNGWNDYIRARGDEMTPETLRKHIDRLFGKDGAHLEKPLADKMKTGIALRGEQVRNWTVAGIAGLDDDGVYRSWDEKKQAGYVGWKFGQEDRQKAMQGFHPDSVFTSKYVDTTVPDPFHKGKFLQETKFGDINNISEELLGAFDAGHAANWARAREFNPILIKQIKAAIEDTTRKTNPKLQEAYNKIPGFKLYVDMLVGKSSGTTGIDYAYDGKGKIEEGGRNIVFGKGKAPATTAGATPSPTGGTTAGATPSPTGGTTPVSTPPPSGYTAGPSGLFVPIASGGSPRKKP